MPAEKLKPPRGRPRAFDRAAALQLALDLFLERGYEGTSIAELVDAMQISPPSLYAAFGAKENLYREAIELYAEGRGRFVTRALQQDLPVEEQVRQILRDAALAFTPVNGATPGCLVSASMLVCTPDNRGVAEHVKTLRAAPMAALAQRIEQAKKRGELPASVNGLTLARFYAAVVTGMAVQARDGAKRRELLDLVDSAMQAWPTLPAGSRTSAGRLVKPR
ncbi:MAG: TetR/AcrR family transcriptional regulator [Cytophagales bacterium]|nr:TetR/AcrR family transcriptional regulator [Rhizobacter sp.]